MQGNLKEKKKIEKCTNRVCQNTAYLTLMEKAIISCFESVFGSSLIKIIILHQFNCI